MGGRLRTTSESNTTTAGTNGSFSYNCLLASDCGFNYQPTVTNPAGSPSGFSITQVLHPVSATMLDLGLYAEDDWKARPNLSVSTGIRYETQNHLVDHHDLCAAHLGSLWVGRAARVRRRLC